MKKNSTKPEDTQFLVSWDNLGIEAVINLTEKRNEFLDKERCQVWQILKGNDKKEISFETWLSHTAHILELRARLNSQRHYEIYTFTSTADLDEESVRLLFERNPQGMADLVRSKGIKIYSDRLRPDTVKIT